MNSKHQLLQFLCETLTMNSKHQLQQILYKTLTMNSKHLFQNLLKRSPTAPKHLKWRSWNNFTVKELGPEEIGMSSFKEYLEQLL